MASSYVNNLRLTEIATGEESGNWGTITNTNLELIGQALGYGTRAIANASTDNITIADGSSDSDRAMYLKLTGGGQACTVTLLPNTASKVWMMQNDTSYTLTFSQGSGANVSIAAGKAKVIATDGAGSGAAVYDVLNTFVPTLADVTLTGTTVYNALNDGTTTLTSTVAELNILDGVTSTAAELNILDGVTATTAELNILDGVTSTAAELNILDGVTSTTAELNILDGVTSTTAELNILDGVTSTTAELNILDGVTSTAAELNILDGVTSTAAELNLVDGITAGTVAASKAVIVDSNKDITGYRNLTATATITGAEVTATSDVRLKSNIETINGALDKVKAMRGVYFDKNDKRSVGVIAQEMQEVMPEVVVTDDTEDKHLSVAYGNLVGVLIEAVKELSEEVSELRNNVQTIKFGDS